jgi:hypothetical protein
MGTRRISFAPGGVTFRCVCCRWRSGRERPYLHLLGGRSAPYCFGWAPAVQQLGQDIHVDRGNGGTSGVVYGNALT